MCKIVDCNYYIRVAMESQQLVQSTVTAVDEAVTNQSLSGFLNQSHVDELMQTALLSGRVCA